MATTQARDSAATPTMEAAFGSVAAMNEQFLAAARKAGNLYMHSCEKAIDGATGVELEFARHVEPQWLRDLIEAQADMTRRIVGSYVGASRRLLK